jgi:hypothetical protein
LADDLAIAAITEALKQRLQAALNQADALGAEVKTERPDKLTDTASPFVNLYLYQVLINPYLRNEELTPRTAPGPGGHELIQTWRTPLLLHYLLSFYGDEKSLAPQRLLAVCTATLHRYAVIPAAEVAAAAKQFPDAGGPLQQTEDVMLGMMNMGLEESYRLWSSFKASYALSTLYEARTAIVSSAPEATPVYLVEDLDLDVTATPPGQALPAAGGGPGAANPRGRS